MPNHSRSGSAGGAVSSRGRAVLPTASGPHNPRVPGVTAEPETPTRAEQRSRGLRLAFAGGGTGGHIQPGLHLLAHARAEPTELPVDDLLWFQTGRAVEQRAFGDFEQHAPWPVERVALRLEPEGGGAPSLAHLARHVLPAVAAARRALKQHRSEVLLGLGGFTCLPAVLAARTLGVPVALLEINAVAGRATRWLAPLAGRVLHAWGPERDGARHLFTGPPLGPEFGQATGALTSNAADAREALGLPGDAPLVLVLGGSQGALSLNAFLRAHASVLTEAGVSVLHQAGPGRLGEAGGEHAGYRPVEFLDDVHAALRAATVVLCRGGASTLAEVGAAELPAWVVPYPHHPDRHQERNAEQLGAGCRIVHEPSLDEGLARELAKLAGPAGETARAEMRQALRAAVPSDAARRIWVELEALARTR